MIPKILHQTWKSRTDIPDNFAHWRASFTLFNPHLEQRLYNDADNLELITQLLPGFVPIYRELPLEIHRVDVIRIVYLYHWGGLYADMDFQCLSTFEPMLSEVEGVLLGRMGTDDRFPHCIPNAMMGSVPGQGFWLAYLAQIERAWTKARNDPDADLGPEMLTGPVVLKRTIRQSLEDPAAFRAQAQDFAERMGLRSDHRIGFAPMKILPGHIWYPLNWNDPIHKNFKLGLARKHRLLSVDEAKNLFPRSLAVTYWSHSW